MTFATYIILLSSDGTENQKQMGFPMSSLQFLLNQIFQIAIEKFKKPALLMNKQESLNNQMHEVIRRVAVLLSPMTATEHIAPEWRA